MFAEPFGSLLISAEDAEAVSDDGLSEARRNALALLDADLQKHIEVLAEDEALSSEELRAEAERSLRIFFAALDVVQDNSISQEEFPEYRW